jgi:hypothetical protein
MSFLSSTSSIIAAAQLALTPEATGSLPNLEALELSSPQAGSSLTSAHAGVQESPSVFHSPSALAILRRGAAAFSAVEATHAPNVELPAPSQVTLEAISAEPSSGAAFLQSTAAARQLQLAALKSPVTSPEPEKTSNRDTRQTRLAACMAEFDQQVPSMLKQLRAHLETLPAGSPEIQRAATVGFMEVLGTLEAMLRTHGEGVLANATKELLKARNPEGSDQRFRQLADKFIERGYLLDLPGFSNFGPLFSKIESSIRLTEPSDGITKIFPEKLLRASKVATVHSISSSQNLQEAPLAGHVIAGVLIPVIDNKACQKTVDAIARALPDGYQREQLTRAIMNNEAVHAILGREFRFSMLNKYDWNTVASGVPEYRISDSRAVHEFISDAASIATSDGFLAHVLMVNAIGRFPGYEYSHKFLCNQLEQLYAGKGLDVTPMLARLKTCGAFGVGESLLDNTCEILGKLTPEERAGIQQAYLDQSKRLLQEIQKTEVRKTGDYTTQQQIERYR